MISRPFLTGILLSTGVLSSQVVADPVLLARTTISGNARDLSGLSAPLENGAPGDLLGGFGSGIAYAGGNTFLAVPDRGPNAISYNAALDDTVAYIDRFQTFQMTLTPSTGGSTPSTLTPTLVATTLLSSPTPLTYGTGGTPSLNSPGTNYFTGRSDGYASATTSLAASNARFDPESIRVAPDGRSVFISDEYGPHIYQFDRSTGQRIRSFDLPTYYGVPNQSPVGNTEISGNAVGRVANRGMEGLAISPDGKTLIGSMQSPLIQDGGTDSRNIRIVTVDIATGAVTHEYVYRLQNANNTVSDIVAIDDHEFLVDERDGKAGTSAAVKQFYRIDTAGATDVKGITTLPPTFTAVTKGATPFIDMLNPVFGLNNADFPAKIEGLAFGDDVVVNGILYHTLWVGHDNDFLTDAPTNLFVFGIPITDLPTYQAQVLSPEPSTFALAVFGTGCLGFAIRRSIRSSNVKI